MFRLPLVKPVTNVRVGRSPSGRVAAVLLGLLLGQLVCLQPSFSKSGVSSSPGSSTVAGAKKGLVLSLRLFPENVTIWGARNAQRFLVLGKYTDGLERDVTGACRFSVAAPGVAQVEAAGQIRALAPGTTVLRTEFEGRRVETAVRVEDSKQPALPSFSRDVETILTRRGCNGSNCHGGVKGRGGFKLSLNAMHPREDYRWILEGGTYQVLTDDASGSKTPRLDLKDPEKSLLLLKPTFSVPHGGGKRFEVGSADYEALLKWIGAGAPYGKEDEGVAGIRSADVFPQEIILEPDGRHQLIVTVQLADGRQKDVTDKVLYTSNNPEVVKVSDEGLLEAVKPGETAVLIRAPGYGLSARVGVISQPRSRYPTVEPRNFIDQSVFAKLRRFHIIPSELSSDGEFLRRVCLDVTGTLPPAHRVRDFLADKDPQKRQKLLETLLQSPEYVDYWTFRFADVFRVALYPSGGNAKFSQFYWEWLREKIAANRPYDEIARERIAAQGYDGASRHYLPILQPPLPQDAVAEEVRIFLGRRLDCAQCHDHPFENWTQNQFWGMAAFFRQLTFYWFLEVGTEAVVLDDTGGYSRRGNLGKVIHPRTKKEAAPTFTDGTVLPMSERKDLRMALASWMTSQPEFAETAVNRMWSYFFGRGIVDPVDDFRSTNPPTHPDLLKALAEDFKRHGYDLKHLIREIVQSRTYQLSTTPNETNRDDHTNFSRMLPRPLDAEILLDAISQVTEIPEVFSTPSGGQAPRGTRAIHLKEPDLYPSEFLEVHGRPTRQMVPERSSKPSLRQALHRLAGSTYTEKLSGKGGRIDRLLESNASDRMIIEEFYLAALSRFPSGEEFTTLEEALRAAAHKKGSRRQAVEDFLWGLLNSQEFTNR
jgi:hypothetical protein